MEAGAAGLVAGTAGATALGRASRTTSALGAALRTWRSRAMARAWSCDTRDSFTPISAPISFIVASSK
jgi:hypothetical protein